MLKKARLTGAAIRVGALVFLILLLAAGTGFFLFVRNKPLPEAIAREVVAAAQQRINGQLKIERLTVSGYNRVTAEQVSVTGGDGRPLIEAGQVDFWLSGLDLVVHRRITPDRVEVSGGRLLLNQAADGSWDLSNLFRTGDRETISELKVTVRDSVAEINSHYWQGEVKIDRAAVKTAGDRWQGQADLAVNGDRLRLTGEGLKTDGIVTVTADRIVLANWAIPDRLPVRGLQGLLNKLRAQIRPTDGGINLTASGELAGVGGECQGWQWQNANGRLMLNDDGELSVDGLTAAIYGGTVKVGGRIYGIGGAAPRLALRVDGQGINLGQLDERLTGRGELAGKLAFSLTADGSLFRPRIVGEVDAGQLCWRQYRVDRLTAAGSWQDGDLEVERLQLAGGGRITGAGSWRAGRVDGYLVVDGLTPGSWIDGLALNGGEVTGQVAVSNFSPADMTFGRIAVDLAVAGGMLDGQAFAGGVLRAAGNRDRLDVTSAGLYFGSGGVTMAGTIARQGELRVEAAGVPLSLLKVLPTFGRWEGHRLAGQLNGNVRAENLLSDQLLLDGSVSLDDLSVDGVNFGRAGARFARDGAKWRIERGELTADWVRLSAAGQLAVQSGAINDLSVNWQDLDLRALNELLPVGLPFKLYGATEGRLRLSGQADDWRVEGSLAGRNVMMDVRLLENLAASFVLTPQQWAFDSGRVVFPGGTIGLGGDGDWSGDNFSISYDIERLDLHRVLRNFNFLGSISGLLVGQGQVVRKNGTTTVDGSLSGEKLTALQQNFDRLGGRFTLSNQLLGLSDFRVEQQGGTAECDGLVDIRHRTLSGSFRVDDWQLASLLAAANMNKIKAEGVFDGNIEISGNWGHPDFTAQGQIKTATLAGYQLTDGRLSVSRSGDRLVVDELSVCQGSGWVKMRGIVDDKGQSDLEAATGQVDIGLLSALAGADSNLSGTVDAVVQLTGEPGQRQLAVSATGNGIGVGNAEFDNVYGMAIVRQGVIDLQQVFLRRGRTAPVFTAPCR
ncbi:MAG: hypothetical protein N3A57_01995 [Negativicutes bacterium]|nr:hypothetical protein [Negativicutes bacterium]